MKPTKFIAFSCTHCPYQDEAAISWLLDEICSYKPSVIVHLGDGHEADAASRWDTDKYVELIDEYKVHNQLLADIRKAAPRRARLIFLEGNHDANILAKGRIDSRLHELIDYRQHEPELKHWRTIPYIYDRRRGTYKLGQVVFSHGYECSVSGVKREALYMLEGSQYGLYVHGHTHRPEPVQQIYANQTTPLTYWRANAGCLRDLKPLYMRRRNTSQWGHGLVRGEAMRLKSPRSSKCWDAETLIRTRYDNWVIQNPEMHQNITRL